MRTAIEFRADSSSTEKCQVERHLRICLGATPGFSSMVTTSPSEPLLAEAARKIWEKPWFNAPLSLLDHISHPSLESGDRGEVVATLLLLLAADKVRVLNDR